MSATHHHDQKEKWKFYSQRYRDKRKDDPVLAQQTKEKEHARYLKRKQLKKIKLVSDISGREKQKRRKNGVKTQRGIARDKHLPKLAKDM